MAKKNQSNRLTVQQKENLGVIGSINELGKWDSNKAIKMGWNNGNIWKAMINYNFSENKEFEFKFIFLNNGQIKKWENGNNRRICFNPLKEIIEPNIKDNGLAEFNNLNGMNILYNYNEHSLQIICEWNLK